MSNSFAGIVILQPRENFEVPPITNKGPVAVRPPVGAQPPPVAGAPPLAAPAVSVAPLPVNSLQPVLVTGQTTIPGVITVQVDDGPPIRAAESNTSPPSFTFDFSATVTIPDSPGPHVIKATAGERSAFVTVWVAASSVPIPPASLPWSKIGPQPPGGFLAGGEVVAQTDEAACEEVFAGQPFGVFYVVANSPVGAPYTGGWLEPNSPGVGPFGCTQLAVGHGPDQRLVVFVTDQGGIVWSTAQSTPGRSGAWTDWTQIGSSLAGQLGTPLPPVPPTPVIGYDVHNAINVFVVAGNDLMHSTETAAGSGQWSGWQNLGGPPGGAVYRPAVGEDLDGRLEVFVRGVQGNVWNIWQTSPGGGWSQWGTLGMPGPSAAASDVAVASDDVQAGSRAGCLELLVVGSDQHLYQISQIAPGNGWGMWADLGGVGVPFQLARISGPDQPARPVIGDNGDGCLEAYLVGGDIGAEGTVYRIRQQSPGGAWSGWASLGGPGPVLSSNPAVGKIIRNDLLQLFVLGLDGNMYNLGQRGNSTW